MNSLLTLKSEHKFYHTWEHDGQRVAVVTHMGVLGWKWKTRKGDGVEPRLWRALNAARKLLQSGAPDLECVPNPVPLHPPLPRKSNGFTGLSVTSGGGKEDFP